MTDREPSKERHIFVSFYVLGVLTGFALGVIFQAVFG